MSSDCDEIYSERPVFRLSQQQHTLTPRSEGGPARELVLGLPRAESGLGRELVLALVLVVGDFWSDNDMAIMVCTGIELGTEMPKSVVLVCVRATLSSVSLCVCPSTLPTDGYSYITELFDCVC